MALSLRIVLIVFSLLTALYIFCKIRKSQMQISDSLFWIIFIFILVLLSVFPQIANYACKWVGVMSPVNFVYLAIIFLLLLRMFTMSVKMSQLESKLYELVQKYAIDENEREHNSKKEREEAAEEENCE